MSKPVNPNNGSAGTAQVGKSQENIALEEPQPLRRKLPEPDEYPIEALGSVLSVPALKVHETVQSPKAVCGQSFLAAASLAVQGYADVEIDGRVFPVSNFFITIADSGERKTATDTVALAPVNKRQKDLHQEFLSLRDVYEADLSAWKKAREDALSGKKSRDEKKA
jgi:hypothetical protein